MKPRVKIDSSILSFIIVLTGISYINRNIFLTNLFFEDLFNVLGFMTIIKGTLIRMNARGHKKAHSEKSAALVTSGPYQLVRNPMYLGSFTLGIGFVLMLWPWWSLPLFVILFYMRFKIQVEKEEKFLTETFGDAYKEYCEKTPRVFPRIKDAMKIKMSSIFSFKDAFSTKEKRGLITWPLLAVVLETFQEAVVLGKFDVSHILNLFCIAVALFVIGVLIRFQMDTQKDA